MVYLSGEGVPLHRHAQKSKYASASNHSLTATYRDTLSARVGSYSSLYYLCFGTIEIVCLDVVVDTMTIKMCRLQTV